MRSIADRFVVVLDANVLYPFRVRDILLRFSEAGLFRARWSPEILNEWTRNLLEQKPHLEKSIHSQLEAMKSAFPEALVEGHMELVNSLNLPDPDDRHVLAAAIQCDAQHIITENLKDFPGKMLNGFGIEAVSADQFLHSTMELYPEASISALRQMRADYKQPAMNPAEFLMSLRTAGLVKTSELTKRSIDVI
ncbi:PIN domain-containing protein [Nisaea nitritireducens]|uniref:PIN domain-containing protein n=1 Tax=Nisaea nitritireducens TaxID=568392 RepID=UPI0018663C5B|nr:PIN domain-containing protein [Nisaea nitritireducens]